MSYLILIGGKLFFYFHLQGESRPSEHLTGDAILQVPNLENVARLIEY